MSLADRIVWFGSHKFLLYATRPQFSGGVMGLRPLAKLDPRETLPVVNDARSLLSSVHRFLARLIRFPECSREISDAS